MCDVCWFGLVWFVFPKRSVDYSPVVLMEGRLSVSLAAVTAKSLKV